MPHIITGEIRKDVYTKEGNGNKGAWKMYAVELSESYKDKDGQRQYTNYRATFFASEAQVNWYDHAFVKGRVISASCEQLSVQQREHNGTNYITLELLQPRLVFSQREGDAQTQQAQQQRPAQNQQRQAQQQPPAQNFDDSIPF
ncbi:MAG: hypothetical protein [Bacteriophage sp.]|nr:MAG: hypothetical protein [Bacteriophage sp.]